MITSSSGWAWKETRVPGIDHVYPRAQPVESRACCALSGEFPNLTLESGSSISIPGGYSMRARLIAVLAVVALVAVACSNSGDDKKADTSTTSSTTAPSGGGTTVDQPGVTKDTIRVGGVVSKTNAVNGPYGSAFDGVKAYFDMVNSDRWDLRPQARAGLRARRPDGPEPGAGRGHARPGQRLRGRTDRHDLLVQRGQDRSSTRTSRRSAGTSTTSTPATRTCSGATRAHCATAASPASGPYMAQELHKKKIGVLAYTVSNSSQCAEGIEKSFKKYPSAEVAFLTKSRVVRPDRLQRRGGSDEGRGRRPDHDVHGHDRGAEPRQGDAQAGPQGDAVPAERLRRQAGRGQRRVLRRQLRRRAVRAVRDRSRSRRASSSSTSGWTRRATTRTRSR